MTLVRLSDISFSPIIAFFLIIGDHTTELHPLATAYSTLLDEITYCHSSTLIKTSKTSSCGESLYFDYSHPSYTFDTTEWYHLSVEALGNITNRNELSTYLAQDTRKLELLSVHDTGWYTKLVFAPNCTHITDSFWLDVTEGDDDECKRTSDSSLEKIQRGQNAPFFLPTKGIEEWTHEAHKKEMQIHCPTRGYPPAQLTWKKDTSQAVQHKGATMLIYESGTYICESCNKNACINDTFRVRIDGREKKPECVKPSHIITPASHYSELRLNCDCTSSSFPWTIHWLSFKKEPSESTAIKTRYQTYNTTNHNTTRTIRIYENETRESTERCVATNIHGDVHRDYLLSVKNGSIEVSWPQAKSLHQEKNNLLQPDQSWTSSQNVITLCLVLVFLIVIAFILRCRHDNVQNSRTYAETTTLTISVKRVVVKRANNHYERISETLEMPSVTIQSIETEYNAYPANIEYLMAPDENWEFPRDNLIFGRIIGEGEFGIVMEALANGLSGKNIATTVAVKMLKDYHDDTDMVDLVSEMELMKILGKHHNILCLLGCCTQKGPLYVITEYAQNGNLQDYLRQHCHTRTHRPDASTLISYALQIAQGMKHLASVKCIHRDLAARNILVTEDLTMKVADFGLARDIRNAYYYRKTSDGRLPLRWMAPESISHCLYTFKTDVWSYGVLLWEIETLGGIPYPLITDMNKLIEELDKGYRLEKPSHCCDQMYQMMQHCWQTEPENRPNFSTIVDTLTEILNNFNHDGSSHIEASPTCLDAESKNHDLTFTTEKHHIYENISQQD